VHRKAKFVIESCIIIIKQFETHDIIFYGHTANANNVIFFIVVFVYCELRERGRHRVKVKKEIWKSKYRKIQIQILDRRRRWVTSGIK